MQLHQLNPTPGSRKRRQIVGRGEGSTLGQTAGKGQKGQSCRSGDTIMNGFEGGQTSLVRRLPKRGFRHPSKILYQPINLRELEARYEAGATIDAKALFEKGLLKRMNQPFKILGTGPLTKTYSVVGSKISKSAEKLLIKSGGSFQPSVASK